MEDAGFYPQLYFFVYTRREVMIRKLNMGKQLNPLEKEFLIKRYKANTKIKLSEFCSANNISDSAFKKWLQQYEESGIEGLTRGIKDPDIIPEGIDKTEENYKHEILKLRIENERLKKTIL